MIDTDKYEGHTPAPWAYATGHIPPDARLITDAPLLLAEVKRLREQMQLLHDTWFADEEMASDVDERMTTLLKEMIE